MVPRSFERLVSVARRREYLAATIVLALIVCAWFWPLLKGDQLGQSFALWRIPPWHGLAPPDALPDRFPFLDAAVTFHPWAEVARDQLGAGHLPLWNPHEWAGTPLLGNMQSALLFPLTWLLLVFPFGYAWGAAAAGKTLLAGLGTYALARELRVGRGGALVSGTAYMLCGPLMMWLQWPLGTVFAMFPWLLFATTRLVRRTTSASVAGLALAFALTLLAGHPESALIAASAAFVYGATLVACGEPPRRGTPGVLATAARWTGAAVLGAAVAAIVLIPFLQGLDSSATKTARSSLVPDTAPSFWSLLQLAMPRLFGNGEPNLYGWPFGYFGLPVLMLALVALAHFRREPAARALAVMSAVILLVVYRVPPLVWFVDHVPPWSTSYLSQQRTYFVLALAGAVGAGASFSALERRAMPLRRATALVACTALGIALAYAVANRSGALNAPASVKGESLRLTGLSLIGGGAVLAAVGRLGRLWALALALAVAALSLADFQNLNAMLPPDRAYPARPPAVAALGRQPRPFRMAVLRNAAETLTLPPDTAALYGIDGIEGYDFPLSRRWSDFQTRVLGFGGSDFPELRTAQRPPRGSELMALRMMNVRYYLGAPGTRPPAPSFETVHRGRDAIVYKDPRALPRAYVVPQALPLPEGRALAALAAGRVDARRTAVVPPDAPAVAGLGRFQAARVEQLAPDHVRVHVPPGSSGWLVLAHAYSPHWEATVDGHEADLQPTNFAAMGVPVSTATRTVDFRLERGGFWLGVAISLVALACVAGLWLLPRYRSRA